MTQTFSLHLITFEELLDRQNRGPRITSVLEGPSTRLKDTDNLKYLI